jgi:hypothetical protein
MATKQPGEIYRGQELHIPLSADGQLTMYVWPLRILTFDGRGCGGPTIGVDVCNEEILRYDCHASTGHWHGGGYDRLVEPVKSLRPFPENIQSVRDQLAWSFQQLGERMDELLAEAEHGNAAQNLDPARIHAAIRSMQAHLDREGDLRSKAVAEGLIAS